MHRASCGAPCRESIRLIGHTVMVLSPWNAPETLKRAWCLFELYTTVVEGKPFSVCFVPAERLAFEAALEEGINVADAMAGNPDDLRMILDEVQRMEGGVSRLNAVVIGEMRAAVLGIVRDMVGTRRAAASLGSLNAVANLLANLGERDEARRLYNEVTERCIVQLGAQHTDTLSAKMNLAVLLKDVGECSEARRLYMEVIKGYTEQLGAQNTHTLRAKMNLATLLAEIYLDERDEARRLYTEVIEGYTAQLGAQHMATLDAKNNLAVLLAYLGERPEARRLYTEVIEGYTAQLGAQHTRTLGAKNNLAVLLAISASATRRRGCTRR
jgi:tetratricopeptide (TPR) repeat protein